MSRSDGKGYIDEPAPPTSPRSVASGSSISEQVEEPEAVVVESLSSSSHSSASLDVEDEDWDLADKGEARLSPADADFTKQYNRLRQERTPNTPLPARNSSGISTNPKSLSRVKDKSDRATTEQVLDNRTRLVLSALTNRGIIGPISRCISTGKEANVYHSGQVAVKIYRTSVLNFRSRQAYIEGEHRFRGEYTSSKNPRKMVRLWAEKEFRNLRRLVQEDIRAPRAVECKENVLVLEYLGDEGLASPRLKDASVPDSLMPNLYAELLVTIRRMYQDAHLVHADLSEYNILYHQSHLYIIDVSQSVEHDHPRAFDFLRSDLRNVQGFFSSIPTLGIRQSWEFVTGEIKERDEASLLKIVQARVAEADISCEIDDAVFLSSFLPRNLADIDPEQEVTQPVDQFIAGSDSDSTDDAITRVPRTRVREEDRAAKRERKQAVKQENRERRLHKMPKAEKQRLVKKSAR